MPEISRSATVRVPPEVVWDFVKDFDNWAPFMMGYQSHQYVKDRESIWKLKAKLAGVTRVTKIHVNITEWDESQHRIAFTIKGVSEPINGSGSVTMQICKQEELGTLVTVEMALNYKGLIGAVMNPLITPLLKEVAQELATKIVAAVEDTYRKH